MGVPDLLTLAQVEALRRQGGPIEKGKTRLEVKESREADTDKAWEECKRTVDKRDRMRCRCCGRKVVKTIELQGNRAEHHHIVRRKKEPKLLTDARNVMLLCLECHQKVTRHKLHIVGKASSLFEFNGQKYLNAYDKALEFKEAA